MKSNDELYLRNYCPVVYSSQTSSDIYVDGSFSGNPTTGISIPIDDIIDESTGNAILVLNKEQYALRHKMRKHPTNKELNYIKNLRGELDLTLNKDSISPIATEYRLIRGRNVGYYKLVDLPESGYEYPGKNSVKLYYRFLYNPDQMMYDGVEIKGMAQCERRSS